MIKIGILLINIIELNKLIMKCCFNRNFFMFLFCFEWILFVLNEILYLKLLKKIDIIGNDFRLG